MSASPNLTLCPPDLREALQLMRQDLADSGLEVVLTPAPDPQHGLHFVRSVWCHNPGWYRELCSMFPRNRRKRANRYTDSTVKRGHVENVLRRLLSGGTTSHLAEPLLGFAKEIQRSEAESVAYVPVGDACAGANAACGF